MRHGETRFNAQHRIQGWCDSPLTERGIEQAHAMGARLRDRGVRIDHAYCSTAERAADTLEIALAEIVGGAASAPSARLLNEADPNLGAHLASGPLGMPAPLPYERLKGLREMNYGNLANDLALYFMESEQTPSLFYLSLEFDKEGRVWGAGGLFIQALPGCPEELLGKVQDSAKSLDKLGRKLSEGMSAREYVETEFSEYAPRHIGHTPICFSCPC